MILPVVFNVNHSSIRSFKSIKLEHEQLITRETPENKLAQNSIAKNFGRNYLSAYSSGMLNFYTGKNNPISFQALPKVIQTKSAYRSYARNGHIGCIYCDKLMFSSDEMARSMHTLSNFAKDAKSFTQVAGSFSEYLKPNQMNIIDRISKMADTHPGIDLETVISDIVLQSEKNVVEKQVKVLEDVSKLSAILPDDKAHKIRTLVQQFKYRLNGIAYVDEYSAKEFFYQIRKLSNLMSDKTKAYEISTIAEYLTHPAFKNENGCLPLKVVKKVYELTKIVPHKRAQLLVPDKPGMASKAERMILTEIEKLSSGNMKNSINDLCDVTKKKLDGVPVVLKFSNKAFSYKMHEILEGENKAVVEQFTACTRKFPASVNNEDAYMVKYKNMPVEKFIYDFLDFSKVSIEHIHPRNNNGPDNIGNWALACRQCNSIHGSDDIFGEKFPFKPEAGQHYFDTIIGDTNKFGYFRVKDVLKQIENYESQTGVKIDSSKLEIPQ